MRKNRGGISRVTKTQSKYSDSKASKNVEGKAKQSMNNARKHEPRKLEQVKTGKDKEKQRQNRKSNYRTNISEKHSIHPHI